MGQTMNVQPATALDYRRLAEKKLPRFLFDYIDGGANDEVTLAANVRDFQAICLRQQVMRDVSSIDTSSTLAGEAVGMPLALAPIGLAGLFGRRGEAQALRAANQFSLPFTLSTVGICPLEELRALSSKPFWFQLYMIRDRGLIKELLLRAQANGCTTLVFTVDLAVTGMRHRDMRNGIMSNNLKNSLAKAWQIGTRPGWIWDIGIMGRPHHFGNLAEVIPEPNDQAAFRQWIGSQFDPSVTWEDIAWLRSLWPGKLLIKGVQEVNDALAAADAGADGVIVSNHGGRQLDGVASSISKLPAITAALGGRVEVLMDGGVRSGLDIFRALALGANGVLIGRPWVWAMAGGGEAGLRDLLATFKRELEVAMALTGVNRIAEITPAQLDNLR